MPLEGLLGGVIAGLILKQDGKEPIIVPVKVSGDGGAEFPIPLPVTIVGGLPGPLPVGYILEPINESLADNMPCRGATTTYYVEKLLDARLAQIVLLIVTNSGDQAVTIQVVGHTSNVPSDASGLHNVGATYSLASGARISFGIVLEKYPFPWLGITALTGASPLTTGIVQVMAYGQRWVKKEV